MSCAKLMYFWIGLWFAASKNGLNRSGLVFQSYSGAQGYSGPQGL